MASTNTLTNKTRIAFLIFFASHIPATICIDLQALFGQYYPIPLQNLLTWYTNTIEDDVMRAPHETWLVSFVTAEVIFQLPFFVLAVHILKSEQSVQTFQKSGAGKGWFRSLCFIYGTHTATTLIPILAYLILENDKASILQKFMVVMIYLPYLLFPAWLVFIAFVSDDVLLESRLKSM